MPAALFRSGGGGRWEKGVRRGEVGEGLLDHSSATAASCGRGFRDNPGIPTQQSVLDRHKRLGGGGGGDEGKGRVKKTSS